MSTTDWLAVLIGVIALLISLASISLAIIQTQRIGEALVQQTRRGGDALLLQQEIERGNAVMHFTSRYFELMKDGGVFNKLGDLEWNYQLWTLHSTEFYFYHHGILPVFMYSQWMIELAELYGHPSVGDRIHASHFDYLHTYSATYPKMISFFEELYKIAGTHGEKTIRNSKTSEYVTRWIKENQLKMTQ